MKYINKQKGFTLVQLMATLFILSVILAASAPMITRAYKKIPTRAIHGMYICYYGNGGLTEEYFNAKTRISQNVVNDNKCKFVPPKQVASFEVELIGGGGGGAYYASIEDKMPEEMEAKYPMRNNSMSGKYVVYPDDEIFRAVFEGAETLTCAPTGTGGKGGNITVAYYPTGRTRCVLSQNGETTNYYPGSKYDYVSNTAENEMYEKCEAEVESRNQKIIDSLKTEDNPTPELPPEKEWSIAEYETPESSTTAYGLSGTPNSYFCKSETIHILEGKTVRQHFSTINPEYKTGSSSTGSNCSDFKTTTPTNGAAGKSFENETIHADDWAYDGDDVERYAAVTTPSGCYAAHNKAEGGDGGDIEFTGGYIYKNKGSSQKTALFSYKESNPTYYPTMYIKSNFNERHYKFGKAGSPGHYERAVVASIPAGCNITIGSGGSAGRELTEEEKKQLQEAIGIADEETIKKLSNTTYGGDGGGTEISCPAHGNIDAFSLYAGGGSGANSNDEEKHEIYPLLGSNIQKSLANHSISEGENGSRTEYSPDKNVFTRYKNMPDFSGFGHAGSGTGIYDTLIGAEGYIRYYLESTLITGEERIYLEEEKDGEENITNDVIMKHAKITGPSSGRPGAIIITW